MSNVFKKAIEAARERAAWEAKIAPNGESLLGRSFTEKEQAEQQSMLERFQAGIVQACKDGKFADGAQAKAALDKLDYDTEYEPLFRFAQHCFPVSKDVLPTTRALGEALAPARVLHADRAAKKDFVFGAYIPELGGDRVVEHKAKLQEDSAPALRGDAAREQEAKRSAEASAAFKEMGAAIRAKAPAKTVEEALKNLDKLGGARVVEGERKKVAAVGQQALFDEETAPIPEGAKKRKPRARK